VPGVSAILYKLYELHGVIVAILWNIIMIFSLLLNFSTTRSHWLEKNVRKTG